MKSKFILLGILFTIGVLGLLGILIRCSFTPIEPMNTDSHEITLRVETTATDQVTTTRASSSTTYTTVATTETIESSVAGTTTASAYAVVVTDSVVTESEMTSVLKTVVIPTCTSTTLTTGAIVPATTVTEIEVVECPVESHDEFVKTFTHNTYYPDYVNNSMKGGSGRTLIGCDIGEGDIKGSIASRYLYDKFKYNYNGKRTKVYLVVYNYPEMTGYYYLDDCCSDANEKLRCNTIDFYYRYPCNCPFYSPIGVAGDIDCYICNY